MTYYEDLAYHKHNFQAEYPNVHQTPFYHKFFSGIPCREKIDFEHFITVDDSVLSNSSSSIKSV